MSIVNMSSHVDNAILETLRLDPTTTIVSTHGSSGFSSTFKVSSGKQLYFVKTKGGSGAKDMFIGRIVSFACMKRRLECLSFIHTQC
jgi:protein-ribulosamine 3-kinase